jgi:hypothetical protein
MGAVSAVVAVGATAAMIAYGLARERVLAARERRWSEVPPAPVSPGWTDVGTDDRLIRRLGLRDLFGPRAVATDARTTTIGTYEAVAAVTSGSGWINERSRSLAIVRTEGSHSLCVLRLPGPLPTFNLLSEGTSGSRFATGFGLGDVDTESGYFNRTRHVVAADDRLAHALLAPTVIAALQDGPQDVTLQCVGDKLVSFRLGRLDQAEVEARLAWMVRVADAIPAFVYDSDIPTFMDDVEMPSIFTADPPKHRWTPPASGS